MDVSDWLGRGKATSAGCHDSWYLVMPDGVMKSVCLSHTSPTMMESWVI